MLVDLGAFLPLGTGDDANGAVAAETAIFSKCLEHRVAIAPGYYYHHPQPGWFRFTFALEPVALETGLKRIEDALADIRLGKLQIA